MTEQLPTRRYASAGGVVVDSTGQQIVVLVRRGRLGPDSRAEARLPKGHIEAGENRQGAALREVGEETGLTDLRILADLGQQTVEFDWRGHHYIRDESCFLMTPGPGCDSGQPETQFEPRWLTWIEALERLSFEAEREWVRRALAQRHAYQTSKR